MPFAPAMRAVLFFGLLLSLTGCSSLGLSLFPTGHFLTKQAEDILARSPRTVDLPRELSMGVEPIHHLQPGDVLLIEPVELDSDVRIPADQKVLTDGSVDLGKYGRVIIAGLTVEGSEALIEQTILESGEEATQINVRMLDPIHRYYVLGEVNSPGSYPLEGFESVLDGILAAGGLTSAASPCKILLARPTSPDSCRVTLPVCYREITQLGDTSTNYQLRPGDRILVSTRSCCEEMMFWQATKTCDRCCRCQTACVDPNMIAPVNPMARVARSIMPVTSSPTNSSSTVETTLRSTTTSPVVSAETSPSDLPPFTSKSGQAERPKRIAPERMPTPLDGELDFDNEPLNRFEPMWITPSEQ